MAVGKYTRLMRDYDGEPTSLSLPSAQLTAANFDAQVVLNVALGAAIMGICISPAVEKIEYGNSIVTPVTASTNPLCQRENRWLVRYHDAVTGDKKTATIGCADLTKLDPNNRGYAEIGDGAAVDAFVTAFEAFVLTDLGNAVEIDSIQFVGANL